MPAWRRAGKRKNKAKPPKMTKVSKGLFNYNRNYKTLPPFRWLSLIIYIMLNTVRQKIPLQLNGGGFFKIGIDLLLRALGQLPLAQSGLTALFGMGKGEPR